MTTITAKLLQEVFESVYGPGIRRSLQFYTIQDFVMGEGIKSEAALRYYNDEYSKLTTSDLDLIYSAILTDRILSAKVSE